MCAKVGQCLTDWVWWTSKSYRPAGRQARFELPWPENQASFDSLISYDSIVNKSYSWDLKKEILIVAKIRVDLPYSVIDLNPVSTIYWNQSQAIHSIDFHKLPVSLV